MKVKFLILICILFFQWNDDDEDGVGTRNRSGGGGGRGRLLMMVSARYLPTRAHTDNMDRLRELIEDILKSDPETTIAIANNLAQQENNNPMVIDQMVDPLNDDDDDNNNNNNNINNRDYDRNNGGGRGSGGGGGGGNAIIGRNPLFGSIHRNPTITTNERKPHKIGRNNYYYYIGAGPASAQQSPQTPAGGTTHDRFLMANFDNDNYDYDRRNNNNNNNNNGIAYGHQRFVFKRDLENDKFSTENGRYPPSIDNSTNEKNEIFKKNTKQNDDLNHNFNHQHHYNHQQYHHQREAQQRDYTPDNKSISRNVSIVNGKLTTTTE